MPSGRMPEVVHKSERPLGPLRSPPWAGHAIVPGVGEPTSLMLTQIRYVRDLEGIEQDVLEHGNVFQGVGAEI